MRGVALGLALLLTMSLASGCRPDDSGTAVTAKSRPLRSIHRRILNGKVKGFDAWRRAVEDDEPGAWERPIAGLQAPDTFTLVNRLTKPHPRLTTLRAMPWSLGITVDF